MGQRPGKDKPMLYRTCKRMTERGNLEGMSTKLDVFYAASKLTDDEYKELTELLAEKEAQSNAKNNS